MAPVLTGVWWGPEAGVVGSGSGSAGVESWLDGGHLVLVSTLSVLTALMLFSVLLLLCAGCQGQKKAVNGPAAGDQENLVNGGRVPQASDKETLSQSAESLVTDAAVSTSHNGPQTSGTILTDEQDASPQPSEEMLSSQSELRASKCPQDRELPRIPPDDPGMVTSGDRTYEVVTEMVGSSRDLSVEDSLYETVDELKDPPQTLGLSNGTTEPHRLLNGHVSPPTPDRAPLSDSVEYASVDLKKKSRHSLDVEARRRSANSVPPNPAEDPEEESPPPVPEKVLDENDNRPVLLNGLSAAVLLNGEVSSPESPVDLRNCVLSESESELYSTVRSDAVNQEHDYSSIAELKGLVPASSSGDLYATVRDMYPTPGDPPAPDDPGYESIRLPKTGGDDGPDAAARAEPDYECVGEFGLGRETSRL